MQGRFELDDHAEVYARFAYSSTTVRTQVAPSGIFGSAFWTPLANSFISAPARATIIDAFNAGRMGPNPVVSTGGELPNWRDINGNNVVDAADDVLVTYGRRTVEFGERSTAFDNNAFQFVVGARGELIGDWDYDVSLQYGESNRTSTFGGFTNVANAANAVDAVPDENGVLTCRNGDPTCVPLNLFGGFGAITPEMAGYSSATAIEQQFYDQTIATASVSGPLPFAHIPWATSPIAVSFGAEYREELGETVPDECLKLAPSSCLGGAGGNTLPVAGGFDVKEIFGEALIPIANDMPGVQSLDIELGYRHAGLQPQRHERDLQVRLELATVRPGAGARDETARGARAERRRAGVAADARAWTMRRATRARLRMPRILRRTHRCARSARRPA